MLLFSLSSLYFSLILQEDLLTHFMPLVSFYTPCKHQKIKGFLMFSGNIERVQWLEIGERNLGMVVYVNIANVASLDAILDMFCRSFLSKPEVYLGSF